MPVTNRRLNRFEEIDVLRGLAAVTVVLSHYFPHWNRFLGEIPIFVPNSYGHNAVLLFFAISGFVIFMTLEKCQSVLDFAVLRFSRLFPTYWATLIFATLVGVVVFGQPFWQGGLVVNLTMFQEFFRFPNLDNVYWSLTVELAFYLNVAWLFMLRIYRFRLLVVFAWLVASAIWAVSVADTASDERSMIALWFALDFFPYFSIGIVLFDVVQRGWNARRIGLIFLAVMVQYLISSWTGAIVAACVATIMTLAVTRTLGFLVCRTTLWLGAISYPLYLIHRNLGFLALDWLRMRGVGPWISISLVACGALALATLFSLLVERPALAVLRQLYRRTLRGYRRATA